MTNTYNSRKAGASSLAWTAEEEKSFARCSSKSKKLRVEIVGMADLLRSEDRPECFQYPYTNETYSILTLDKLRRVVRGKKRLLFVVGGGGILKLLPALAEGNDFESITGIDINLGQLLNFKHLCKKINEGKDVFIRRNTSYGNTVSLKQTVIAGSEWLGNVGLHRYEFFLVPGIKLERNIPGINLIHDSIERYLQRVPDKHAPDVLYLSNVLEWNSDLYSVIHKSRKIPKNAVIMAYKTARDGLGFYRK
ncbi:MAG: hypothetical protein LVQ97_04405 [Candidatus Micrarchaeales archaeon]|jgi:hypothetical protein|uniref:Uncharacterized protein n=1 Tax=Candidatus Micrarchaeum acidiphilum ARMAN-2 TaxID=425595 RepID=C7DH43_MICA2|nr:MAG: hypothetical protein UNLARM2_0389 [Candidatus Micrarchaeum acidiphilum ARMAN-2]MCW6161398.1 hypothetical protein [Candidatus Micrarchaeales archaeon]